MKILQKKKCTKDKCTKDYIENKKKKLKNFTAGSLKNYQLNYVIFQRGVKLEFNHKPVMLEECIKGLNIKPNGIYVDGTLRWSRS